MSPLCYTEHSNGQSRQSHWHCRISVRTTTRNMTHITNIFVTSRTPLHITDVLPVLFDASTGLQPHHWHSVHHTYFTPPHQTCANPDIPPRQPTRADIQALTKCMTSILDTAAATNINSVAVCALGSGIFGWNDKLAREVLVRATVHWEQDVSVGVRSAEDVQVVWCSCGRFS